MANPQEETIVRREMTLAKEMGINLLRPWRKPLQPWIIDMADEMGMLLVGGIPVECMNHWPEVSPQLAERVAIEVRESVLRDRNHASIVWWEMFNEIVRPELGRLKHRMALLARSLDPTRLIADESGGWWGGAHLYLPYSAEPTPFNELHCYLRAPVDDHIYQTLLTLGDPSGPLKRGVAEQEGTVAFLSEVGFGSFSDLPKDVARYEAEGNPLTPDTRSHKDLLNSLEAVMHDQGVYDVFGTPSAVCAASQAIQAEGNKLQVEAVRLNPYIHGFAVHAYTDGDWVYGAGILDMWREPKQVYYALKEAYAPRYLALRVTPANVVAGQEATLTVTAINELARVKGKLVIEMSQREAVTDTPFQVAKTVDIKPGVHPVAEIVLPTAGLQGDIVVSANLMRKSEIVTQNTFTFFAVDPAELAQQMPNFAVIDPRGLIDAPPFTTETPVDVPVVVACEDAPGKATLAQFTHIFDFVQDGGTAIFLKPPIHRSQEMVNRLKFFDDTLVTTEENALLASGLFALELRSRMATGMWVPVNHVVKAHPIFDGLPVNVMMDHVYQNVCPAETLVDVDGETVVGALSFEWSKGAWTYLGCHEFWWASSLVIVPYGKGRMIISTLRLLENLGKDPVADVIFRNLVSFNHGSTENTEK